VCAALLVAVLSVGCSRGGGRVVGTESGAVDIAVARPTFTLLDTDGHPFDFASQTRGTLTFLEFGYTHCPDVCPVHMANLATVLKALAPSDRMRIKVVFVTVDPDRDSAAVLRRWLDNFDSTFVGLRGPADRVNAAQGMVGFGPAAITTAADGAVTVTHAAPVLAFTADDTAHVMYPFGTRQQDWARDIPRLLERHPNGQAAIGAPRSAIEVERAYVVIPAGQAPAALYLTVRNTGSVADSLVGGTADGHGEFMLHESVVDKAKGLATMRMLPALAVPAHGSGRLAPAGAHGMIALQGPLARGDRISLALRFARAGVVRATATVIAYADVDTATTPR
jgi:protein SCO1/2